MTLLRILCRCTERYCSGCFRRDRKISPNAERLLNYLADCYGKCIISGQMDAAWTTNEKIDMIARVHSDTGKYPALKGFDYIQLPYNRHPFHGGREQTAEAIEWWEGKNNGVSLLADRPEIHGIVAFCWHWRVGQKKVFYTDETNFRIPWKDGMLDTGCGDFEAMIEDLELLAAQLRVLRDRDIPVLWRPLHEAAGGWFWWGASGPDPCIALWEFMHRYLTDTCKLDNLIWVWNGQDAAWFPNPGTVHIVGYDVYPEADTPQSARDYSSQRKKFDETLAMIPESGRATVRIVALSENGAIPDPDECRKDGAMWSWFMTWNDCRGSSPDRSCKENFWTGGYHNTEEHKLKVYNHDLVVTLDKLPDLTAYREG